MRSSVDARPRHRSVRMQSDVGVRAAAAAARTDRPHGRAATDASAAGAQLPRPILLRKMSDDLSHSQRVDDESCAITVRLGFSAATRHQNGNWKRMKMAFYRDIFCA